MTSWLLCDVELVVDTLRYMLLILVDPYVRSLVGGVWGDLHHPLHPHHP